MKELSIVFFFFCCSTACNSQVFFNLDKSYLLTNRDVDPPDSSIIISYFQSLSLIASDSTFETMDYQIDKYGNLIYFELTNSLQGISLSDGTCVYPGMKISELQRTISGLYFFEDPYRCYVPVLAEFEGEYVPLDEVYLVLYLDENKGEITQIIYDDVSSSNDN